jgi:hypothetical protein
MEPSCMNIKFIRGCVYNTCGFHEFLFLLSIYVIRKFKLKAN